MITKKVGTLFLAVIFCFFPSSGFAKISAETFTDELGEYSAIFKQIYSSDDIKKKIEIIYPRIIRDYEAFIKKYPGSRLIDDAKLRIAEFYNISGSVGEKKFLPNIKFSDRWREKANKWLKDVVINHPRDKISDPLSGEDLGEPAAALALYYLYAWNNRDERYLKELFEKYPESRLAIEMRSRGRR